MSKNDDVSGGTPDEVWESEMSREFDQRVRDLNEAPFSLDHVKGKAMTIKRNRRLAVAGGMLAAAAVIVPVAVISSQGIDRTDGDITPATTSPSPTQAVDPPSSALGVDYLEGKTWVRPDGTTVALGVRYDSGTMLGDDLLAVRTDENNGWRTIDVIDQAGEVTESIGLQSELVVNADHTVVAYVEPSGNLMTLWDPDAGTEGRVALATGLGGDVTATAVVGGPSCYEAPKGDGCTVYYNHGDGETPPLAADSHGITDEFVTGPAIGVEDVTDTGIALVQKSYSDEGSCNGIYDLATRAYAWETCDYFLLDANRTGTHVAATHAYLDGVGNGWVAILDAAGNEVVRVDPEGSVYDQVWEDDDSLLATVYDQGAWSVWRLNTDGTKEQAVSGSRAGDDLNPAYTLLAGS